MDLTMATNDLLQPFLDMMNDRMDRFEDKIDQNTKDIASIKMTAQKTLTQARYTNGRVTKLENSQADGKAKKTAKKFNLAPSVIYLIALGAVILLVIIAALLGVPLGGLLK